MLRCKFNEFFFFKPLTVQNRLDIKHEILSYFKNCTNTKAADYFNRVRFDDLPFFSVYIFVISIQVSSINFLFRKKNQTLDYNVPGGKQFRVMQLIMGYKHITDKSQQTPEKMQQLYMICWALELVRIN